MKSFKKAKITPTSFGFIGHDPRLHGQDFLSHNIRLMRLCYSRFYDFPSFVFSTNGELDKLKDDYIERARKQASWDIKNPGLTFDEAVDYEAKAREYIEFCSNDRIDSNLTLQTSNPKVKGVSPFELINWNDDGAFDLAKKLIDYHRADVNLSPDKDKNIFQYMSENYYFVGTAWQNFQNFCEKYSRQKISIKDECKIQETTTQSEINPNNTISRNDLLWDAVFCCDLNKVKELILSEAQATNKSFQFVKFGFNGPNKSIFLEVQWINTISYNIAICLLDAGADYYLFTKDKEQIKEKWEDDQAAASVNLERFKEHVRQLEAVKVK